MLRPWLAALTYPLRGGAGATVAVFALLFTLAWMGRMFGLPLLLILLSWTAKYAFILLEQTARGHADPPVLDIDMMNPVSELRPWYMLALLSAAYAVYQAFDYRGLTDTARVFAALFLLLLPAALALLTLEGSLLAALHPRRVFGIVRAMGFRYLWLPACLAAGVAGMVWLDPERLPLPLSFALRLYLLFAVFHITGRILYVHRDRLGLAAEHSPEREAEQARDETDRKRRRVMDEIYALRRGPGLEAALSALEKHLAEVGDNADARRWYQDALFAWEDPSTALWFARTGLDRLLRASEAGAAIDLCARCLARNPAFRPAREDDTLALAEAALAAGRPALALTMVRDFSDRFPGSSALQSALLMAAGIALEHENDETLARCLLDELQQRFPATAHDPRADRLRGLLPPV